MSRPRPPARAGDGLWAEAFRVGAARHRRPRGRRPRLLTLSAVDYQGVAVAVERAGWSALGIALGLAIAELGWRLPPHLART